jgi:hypothetical protein
MISKYHFFNSDNLKLQFCGVILIKDQIKDDS